MQRRRNGEMLTLWQLGLLIHLYAGGRINWQRDDQRYYYWLEAFDGSLIRLHVSTAASLKRRGMLTGRGLDITARGRDVVESLSDEEIVACRDFFRMHDYRVTKKGPSHGIDVVEERLWKKKEPKPPRLRKVV